jgi:hypothetical protein
MQELYQANQHRKKLKLLKRIIDGTKAQIEMTDLYMEMNPAGNIPQIDKILFTTYAWDTILEEYEKQLADTYHWFESHGFEPAEPTMEVTKFPEPYRWRVPAWLRKPVVNFIKSLFKPGHKKRELQ